MLGNKTQHNMLNMGNKKNNGIQYLGSKIQSKKSVLQMPQTPTPTENRSSSIEKYSRNK